ncbi:hemerythrin domain-containing protein [Nocardiopsis suaedae]|uniref:Hemerythrin domain-containing protein n=1 Tax=Nocardiopsis suaedae TaxID=3018444 RepID=A0ABT4THX2_9ACTN|nr:hemerythrin domain-containing protein [Nocardiopsis suaedae]MDA2803869.1 hemerythrin domain-containing protein [Nocardiopsis suaedae]
MAHGTRDLTDVVTEDHRRLEAVFSRLEEDAQDRDDRRRLVEHLITELVGHAVAEEHHMYPVVRARLIDGEAQAEDHLREHAEIEEVMKELEGADTADTRFEELLRALTTSFRRHAEHEEREPLARLREACSGQELIELGEKADAAKRTAPTRPHPGLPDTPPANRVLDPGAGLVDRVRDRMRASADEG